MSRATIVDTVAGLVALIWALCASIPWDLGGHLAQIVHPGVAGAFGLAALTRAYKTLTSAAALLLLAWPLGCAHVTAAKTTDVLASTAAGLEVALEPVETPEARKAREMLAEIQDALEVLRTLAPAVDAQIDAAREAAR